MSWRKVHQLREHQISMQGHNTDLLLIFFIKEIKLNYTERNYAAVFADIGDRPFIIMFMLFSD